MCQIVCICRCAFLPIDTQAGKAQNEKLLQQAQPHTLIWAGPECTGGAGPFDPAGLSHGCQPVQMPNSLGSLQEPANDQTSTRDIADNSANAKHVSQQLSELAVHWQQLTAGKPWLPFCYVMYTSGSTGSPAGVCGTETGWAASSIHPAQKLHQVLCISVVKLTYQACSQKEV